MEVAVKSPKEWLREIEVEIEPERLKSRIEGLIKEYRNRAEVPGFRRGHVPKYIMERRFGSTLESAAVEELVEQTLTEALEKHSIKPASRVQFLDLEVTPDKTIRYRAAVEVVPEFELQPYTNLNLNRPTPTGFDEEFEKRLSELREKCAHFQPVQRPAQNGDFVVVDYTITEGNKKLVGPKTNVTLQVGNENNHPEVNKALLGVNPGDERNATITFPADHEDKTLAGRTITYQFTVRAIREKHLPEITEEFATDLGFENLDALRQAINNEILAEREEQIEDELKRQIIDQLVAAHNFEPPQSWVEEHITRVRQQLNLPDTPEIREKILPVAVRSAKFDCIVMRIAAKENIEVGEDDIKQQVDELARSTGRNPDEIAPLVDTASYRFYALQRKVLRLILDQANIK